jgi:hypothetical protein
MFALIAAIVWFLGAFGVALGTINVMYLALGFLGLHFAFGGFYPSVPRYERR